MKLNKIALAMAAGSVFAVPMAAQADVTISGVVQVQAASSDAKDAELTIKAGDVRINFAADTDLGFGTGYGNIRLDADNLGESGNDDADFDADSVKVGIKGDFGDISIGDVGSAVGKGLLGGDLYDSAPGCNECIAYSNTFSGLGFKAAFHPAGNFAGTRVDVAGVEGVEAVAAIPATETEAAVPAVEAVEAVEETYYPKGKDAAISVGVDYTISGVALGAGMWSHGDDSWTAIGAGYSLNGIDLGLSYEIIGAKAANDEKTNIGASAYYSMNDWKFGAKLYKLDGQIADGNDDEGKAKFKDSGLATKFRIEATKSLSDSMSINFQYNSLTDDATIDGAGDLTDYRVMLSKTF